MMFDWEVLIWGDVGVSTKPSSDYLKRNLKKRDAYDEAGFEVIFLEPKHIYNPETFAEKLNIIIQRVGDYEKFENHTIDYTVNTNASQQYRCLATIKDALLPLYNKTKALPTTSAMREAGLVGVEVAIRKFHGGRAKVAKVFGWPMTQVTWMPRGFYSDINNVCAAIKEIVPTGTLEMPSTSLIQEKYPPGLLAAIHRDHGGLGGVAEKCGLHISPGTITASSRAPKGTWSDYNNAKNATLSLVEPGTNTMPTKAAFHRAHMIQVYNAIVNIHGGLETFSAGLGLTLNPKVSAIRKSVTNQWHERRK
jgi:hypothetical protein